MVAKASVCSMGAPVRRQTKRKIEASTGREPTIGNPTGKPLSMRPARTEAAGLSAKVTGGVKATNP
jgi:hypothetical protein